MTEKRQQHWNDIYANKSALEVSWYQKQPELSLQLIRKTGAGPESSIIDVGGGASTLVDHLCAEGYQHLAVLDIAVNALKQTRLRLAEQSDSVEWIVADVTEFRPDHQFDIWHDRAVFHFLTEQADRDQYVASLKHALQPGGHLIIAAFDIGGPKRCSGLEIVQYDAEKMSAELGDVFELIEQASETHTTPSNAEQAFRYYHYRHRS